MRLVIDDYGYIYPKLAYLNKIVMTKKELGKIKDLSDFSGLISFAQRYFPGLKPKAETAEDFEKELWVIFFKIIEKILVSSPNMVQKFLKTYLIRFEIWNIRIAVIEILVKKEIGHQVFPFFKKPQQILEHMKLYENLKRADSLEDIKQAVKKTNYQNIIEKSLEKYEETGELFYLEQSLERFYFKYLLKSREQYSDREKELFGKYIEFSLDFYNLNFFLRAIYNNFPPEITSKFIINEGLYLKEENIKKLKECKDLKCYFKILKVIFKSNKDLIIKFYNKMRDSSTFAKNVFLRMVNDILVDNFRKDLEKDLKSESIGSILKILVSKEIEINALSARATQIEIEREKII